MNRAAAHSMQKASLRTHRNWVINLRVYVPFAAGFYLSYLYRVVNNIISPDISTDLGINPSDMGLLSSAYFLTFAACQLPLGILLDRFGPRRVEALLLLFAALGAYVFSVSDGLGGLVFGRALIGFGVSACLMGAFTAFVMWFPKERLPMVNGFQLVAGGLGALTATAPVEAALDLTDWRGVFLCLAGLSLAVSIAVFWVVPERNTDKLPEKLSDLLKGVITVYSSRDFRMIAPLTMGSQATHMSIIGLWAGPWLRDVALMDRTHAAEALLLVTLSMMAGFLSLGTIAERLTKRGINPFIMPIAGMVMFMAAQSGIVMGLTEFAVPLWILFGFFGTSGILAYSALSQRFPTHLAGRVNTGLNVLVFVAAFCAQWGIGIVINHWPALSDGRYPLIGFQSGFGIILGLQILALFWFIFSKVRR